MAPFAGRLNRASWISVRGGPAERRRVCLIEARDRVRLDVEEQRRRMARRRVGDLARVGIDGEEDGGRHAVERHEAREPAGDLAGRGVVVCQRAKGVPQLSHQHRGRDTAPGDVPHGQVEDPVRTPHGVVPVATDRKPDAACVVATREVEPLDRRQGFGQQAALERDRDVVLPLVAARPVERSRRVLRMGDEQRLLGPADGPLLGEQKRHRAGRATRLGPERQPVEQARRRLQLRDRLAEHRREIGSRERDVIGRLVRESCDRNDGRVVARKPVGTLGRERRDRQVRALVLAHGNDHQGMGECRRQSGSERSRDLARGGGVSEGLRELVPVPDLEPLRLLLASRAQQSPADDAEHGEGRCADHHELEEEPLAGRREDRSRQGDRSPSSSPAPWNWHRRRPVRSSRRGRGHR